MEIDRRAPKSDGGGSTRRPIRSRVGWRRRALALAGGPRLILLDEPMAGMGGQDSARMKRLLAEIKKFCTLLLVEHDMDAVFGLAYRVTVLVGGRNVATGSPDQIRADQGVRDAYLGHASEP